MRRGASAPPRRGSLRLNVKLLAERLPAVQFRPNELASRGRCPGAARNEAHVGETARNIGSFEDTIDRRVDLLCDRRWQTSRPDDHEPTIDADAGQRLGHGGEIVET